MPESMSAEQFIQALEDTAQETRDVDREEAFNAIPMRQIFALAKQFMTMPPKEIEKLLESPFHKVRVGAVSIMDWQARDKKTSEEQRKELYDLYIKRHDRIDNWDLVDRSAPFVVGRYPVSYTHLTLPTSDLG